MKHVQAASRSVASVAGRLISVGAAVAAAGLIVQFPLHLCLLFAGASVVVVSTSERPWLSRLLGTLVAAWFAAQVTDLFITPFTFGLRFVFFFVMIGLVVAYVGSQLDSM
jgi:hypothetical protein